MTVGVLTGDIVDSTRLTKAQLDDVMSSLRAAQTEVSEWLNPAWASFARREGDGWQLALTNPRYLLRAALYLRAALRRDHGKLITRIALATGDGTLPTNGDLNAAHGQAFTASGRLLDDLDAPLLMGHASGGALAAATALADHLSQKWTPAQCRSLCPALNPAHPTNVDIAQQLGVSRQTVDQALIAAGLPALRTALQAMENQA